MVLYSSSVAAICRTVGDETSVVGAGTVLDSCHILTCAHVVNEALGRSISDIESPNMAKLSVRIPIRANGEEIFDMMVVGEYWRGPVSSPRFGEVEDVAVLRTADHSKFPSNVSAAPLIGVDLQNDPGANVCMTGFPGGRSDDRVFGKLNGINLEGRIRIDPVSESRAVTGGFSGAGRWG